MKINNTEVTAIIRNGAYITPVLNGVNLLDSAVNVSIPSPTITLVDSGNLLVNPMMGIETGYGLTSPALLTSAITGVDIVGKTVTVNTATWYGRQQGIDFPHFDANYNFVGVLRVVTVASPTVYSIISGSDPVVGGFILKQSYDFTLCRCKFSWSQLEIVKGTYDWVGVEKASGIKAIRELNRVGWGKKKQIIIDFILDYPSASAHQDIPTWLSTELTDCLAYNVASGQGTCPNYSNSTLIAYHGSRIQAIADTYVNDPIFAFAMIGSIGHWGECWYTTSIRTMITNTIFNQYIQQYANSFGGERCRIRRSIGNAGALGMGLYNHGFNSASQVFTIEEGAIDGLQSATVDDYSESQPAVTNWKTRHKTGEPFGTYNNAEVECCFADEPATLVSESGAWTVGSSWSLTVGAALSTYSVVARARTNAGAAVLPSTEYICRIRPGQYAAYGYGYSVRVIVVDSGNIVRQVTTCGDRTKVTTTADAATVYFTIEQGKPGQADMTAAMIPDCMPRFYRTSTGDISEVNKKLFIKQITDYGLSAYSMNFNAHLVDARATDANEKEVLKLLGYRLYVSTGSVTTDGQSVSFSIRIVNAGIATPFLNGHNIQVGLYKDSILRISVTIGSPNAINVGYVDYSNSVDIKWLSSGTYQLVIGVVDAGGVPVVDFAAGVKQGTTCWYSLGTVTLSR